MIFFYCRSSFFYLYDGLYKKSWILFYAFYNLVLRQKYFFCFSVDGNLQGSDSLKIFFNDFSKHPVLKKILMWQNAEEESDIN